MMTAFDRVVCINLDRRPDRWEEFESGVPLDWPFAPIERVAGVDGQTAEVPEWYGAPPSRLNRKPRDWQQDMAGVWGCLQSHLAVWRDALAVGLESIMVLEDDALFCGAFGHLATQFIEHVPDHWEALYFGGEHTDTNRHPPEKVNAWVLRGRKVGRSHAYAMRRPMMEAACQLLGDEWQAWRSEDYHQDHRLSTIHSARRVYAPTQWLVGQAAGTSDVRGVVRGEKWWSRFNVVEGRETETNGG